jgi:hypothetical protein
MPNLFCSWVLFTGPGHTEKINRGPQDPPDNFQPFTVLRHHDRQSSAWASCGPMVASDWLVGSGTVGRVLLRNESAIDLSLAAPGRYIVIIFLIPYWPSGEPILI